MGARTATGPTTLLPSSAMAPWAIGDVHGCWETLQRLLGRIAWEPERDRLWLVGDLVNRGPRSLEVLRWAFRHRERLVSVLGNHDLHLVNRALGLGRRKRSDRFDEILAAPDHDQLVDWLRRRPLVHREGRQLLVHAGLWPGWGVDEVVTIAGEVEACLATADGEGLLLALAGGVGRQWRPDLAGTERLCFAVNVLTLVRTVRRDGPCLDFTGPPAAAPAGCEPWFEKWADGGAGLRALFGHWAALGHHQAPAAVCLDSACVYGGALTAVSLDDGRAVHEPCADRV